MRPVGPLEIPGLVRADLSGVFEPMVEFLIPSDLLVDTIYQRDLSPKSIALIIRIVAGWDWLKFKPPVVALTNRGFETVDGQHTAIAAATLGLPRIPCIVIDGSTVERRASAFVSHATNRLQATPTQIWHAAVAAGDEDALTIRNVCIKAGLELVSFPPAASAYRPGQTIALAAIRKLIDKRGAMRAREVLQALAQAGLAPIAADMIKAADALLNEDEYRLEFDLERVTATIKGLGSRAHAEAREIAVAKHLPMWRALVAVMFKHRTKRAKPDHVEPPITVPETADSAVGSPQDRQSLTRRFVERPPTPLPTLGDPEPGRSALDQRRVGA